MVENCGGDLPQASGLTRSCEFFGIPGSLEFFRSVSGWIESANYSSGNEEPTPVGPARFGCQKFGRARHLPVQRPAVTWGDANVLCDCDLRGQRGFGQAEIDAGDL